MAVTQRLKQVIKHSTVYIYCKTPDNGITLYQIYMKCYLHARAFEILKDFLR